MEKFNNSIKVWIAVAGAIFTLICGAYVYAYTINNNVYVTRTVLENKITVLETKIDNTTKERIESFEILLMPVKKELEFLNTEMRILKQQNKEISENLVRISTTLEFLKEGR